MTTFAPQKDIFTAGSGKPKYYERRGKFGLMELKTGDRFRTAWDLEKSYNDSYHRAGVGIDFCQQEQRGAYSCLITGRGQYDQDTDDGSGDTVRFQQSKFGLANRAMQHNIESKQPVRLFSPEWVEEPDSFGPSRFMTFRGMFRVTRFDPSTGIYLLKRVTVGSKTTRPELAR